MVRDNKGEGKKAGCDALLEYTRVSMSKPRRHETWPKQKDSARVAWLSLAVESIDDVNAGIQLPKRALWWKLEELHLRASMCFKLEDANLNG